MPRARWWVIGVLSVVTLLVVTLDVAGVIFTETEEPAPPPPVAVPVVPDRRCDASHSRRARGRGR